MTESNELRRIVLDSLYRFRQADSEIKVDFHSFLNYLRENHLPSLDEGDFLVELLYLRTKRMIIYSQYVGRPNSIYIAKAGIEYLTTTRPEYYSCFISYGTPDKQFTEKLVLDMQENGVDIWFYSQNATPGERSWQEIGQNRRKAEKMIVLCSGNSLIRDGILKEIEDQIDEDPNKIVPISLDHLWNQAGFRVMRGPRDLKPFLMERNYADFTNPERYDEELKRLLNALRKD